MTPRKRQILEAAALCFMEKGYHAASVDDVAARLGSTKGRIYHHYPSKLDLFVGVHREGMARLFEAVGAGAAVAGDGLTVLASMLRAHARAMLDHHVFESVVVQGVHMHRFGPHTAEQRHALDELLAERDRFELLFKRQVETAMADGTMAPGDVSVTAKTMLGGLQWSFVWYRPEADADAEARGRLADEMVRVLVEGLRHR